VTTALPGCSLGTVQLLDGGLSNTNFKVSFDSGNEPIVLRVYDRDPAACRKEVDVLRLVHQTVPVPEVVHAEPEGIDGLAPFSLLRYVEGITVRQLKATGDTRAFQEASYSVGRTLAAIGQYTFPKPGWLGPGPEVGGVLIEGSDSFQTFIDACLGSPNLQRRVDRRLIDELHGFVWSWATQLAHLGDECALVHCDFNSPNLLVRRVTGKWEVAAVLDWEFAISGSPLNDIGNFLRYERSLRPLREPHFSRGFQEGGGELPEGWRRLSRIIDLTSLCEILTRDELPGQIVAEVVELVEATIEDRDPR
jgi:fructokinase